MDIMLILTLDGIEKYYGNIPEVGDYPDKFELVSFEENETDDLYLDEHFATPVNKLCDSLLGYGDVDYLNAEKCKLLVPWLEENIKTENKKEVIEIYNRLLDLSKRAIELNTGLIIEM